MEQGAEELAAQAAGPTGAAAAGALMAVDAAQAAAPAAKPDSLASLLGLLASTYGMHPGECGLAELKQACNSGAHKAGVGCGDRGMSECLAIIRTCFPASCPHSLQTCSSTTACAL